MAGKNSVVVKVTPPCASVVPGIAAPGLACGEKSTPVMNTLYGEFGSSPVAENVTTTGTPATATAGVRVRRPLQLAGSDTGAGPAEAMVVGVLGAGLAGVAVGDAPPAGGG